MCIRDRYQRRVHGNNKKVKMDSGDLNPGARAFVPKKKRDNAPVEEEEAKEGPKISPALGEEEAKSVVDSIEVSEEEISRLADEFLLDTINNLDSDFDPGIHNLPCPHLMKGSSCPNRSTCPFMHFGEEVDEKSPDFVPPVLEDYDCNICYERILAQNKQFGLLSHCDHPFCLDCIRKWRGGYLKNVPKEFFRLCPICRKESYLVIPSAFYLQSGPDKDYIIEQYKASLSSIPCKYFNKEMNFCPFGNSCFYAHIGKEGKPVTLPWTCKLYYADGREEFESNWKLSDQITIPKKRKKKRRIVQVSAQFHT
eukprot:TRINITY_DN43995_c0_g1_i2.p1 TRINITY_DN43995_c0_g1~~TRINITY_DN43995_c0_g1_i2.p1  ORF type:complete len:310 (-),score=48.52 TRINITY_DN43995_c0_g1_i2:26-955(-)